MGNYSSGRASDFGGINIESRRADSLNGLRFDSNRADPTSPNDVILYRGAGSSLRFFDGSNVTTLGSAGGLVNFSMDDSYDDGRVISVDAGAVTLNGVGMGTAVLALTGDGASAGALITFAHTTNTRNDLLGTGSTWKVTGQGAGELQTSLTTPAIVSYGAGVDANLTINAKGTGTISLGATSTGAITLTRAVTATASITITGTADINVFTITNGDAVVTLGSIDITDNDNAGSLLVTNGTATTIGAIAAGGVIAFDAAGLTTGALLSLELTEATLNGGWYVRAWDVTVGAQVFSVGEDGKTVIAGVAAGTDSLTITAGDIRLTSGHIVQTAGNLTLTSGNATLTAGNLVLTLGNATLTAGNLLLSAGTATVTSANASALAVGRVGATNPVFVVDASTALVATGISIKGAAAAGGVALAAISSGAAEALTIDAKGTGGITLAGTSTGAITLGAAVSIAAAKNVTFAAGAGALDMLLATGGLKLETGTVTGAAGAATLSKLSGVVTTEVLTTAAAGTQLYTITNSQSAAADKIFVNVSTAGTGESVCSNVIPGAGSFTVLIKNVSAAAAFNAAVKIYFMVLKTA